MVECKLVILGFGSVGQGVANVVAMKKAMISKEYGVDLKVVAAADSSTSAICADSEEGYACRFCGG